MWPGIAVKQFFRSLQKLMRGVVMSSPVMAVSGIFGVNFLVYGCHRLNDTCHSVMLFMAGFEERLAEVCDDLCLGNHFVETVAVALFPGLVGNDFALIDGKIMLSPDS